VIAFTKEDQASSAKESLERSLKEIVVNVVLVA
jgi:hypothetical protein